MNNGLYIYIYTVHCHCVLFSDHHNNLVHIYPNKHLYNHLKRRGQCWKLIAKQSPQPICKVFAKAPQQQHSGTSISISDKDIGAGDAEAACLRLIIIWPAGLRLNPATGVLRGSSGPRRTRCLLPATEGLLERWTLCYDKTCVCVCVLCVYVYIFSPRPD